MNKKLSIAAGALIALVLAITPLTASAAQTDTIIIDGTEVSRDLNVHNSKELQDLLTHGLGDEEMHIVLSVETGKVLSVSKMDESVSPRTVYRSPCTQGDVCFIAHRHADITDSIKEA